METTNTSPITVKTTINAPVSEVWSKWNNPEDIMQWCFASDTWHAPKAENNLQVGGKFTTTMAAKDGSFSFDFGGTYDQVVDNQLISYTMEDGRNVKIEFTSEGDKTIVSETFDPENQNSAEMQRDGWQAILDNFKKHVEETN